jgi:hypothetical protein
MNGKPTPVGKHGLKEEASTRIRQIGWQPADSRKKLMIERAQTFGVATTILVQRIWNRAAIQAYWDCLDVFRCARQYSPARLERATCQAIALGLHGAKYVREILIRRLDLVTGSQLQAADDVQFLLPFMGDFLDVQSSKRS